MIVSIWPGRSFDFRCIAVAYAENVRVKSSVSQDWTVVAEITDEMSHVVNVVCACQIGKYVFARISDGARLRLGGRSPNHLAPFRAPDLDAFEDELRDRP